MKYSYPGTMESSISRKVAGLFRLSSMLDVGIKLMYCVKSSLPRHGVKVLRILAADGFVGIVQQI